MSTFGTPVKATFQVGAIYCVGAVCCVIDLDPITAGNRRRSVAQTFILALAQVFLNIQALWENWVGWCCLQFIPLLIMPACCVYALASLDIFAKTLILLIVKSL